MRFMYKKGKSSQISSLDSTVCKMTAKKLQQGQCNFANTPIAIGHMIHPDHGKVSGKDAHISRMRHSGSQPEVFHSVLAPC